MSHSRWGDAVSFEHAGSSSRLGRSISQKLAAPRLITGSTAHKSFKKIYDLIMDDESRIIGVHGMIGVGKTTIVMNVYNHLLETQPNKFDMVIRVNASTTTKMNVHKYYGSFLRDQCKSAVKAVKRQKRFLLILDGLLDAFSFNEVGLIKPNKINGCKLVFTTRSVDVCTRMECKQDCIVKVDLLSEKEALELFWEYVMINVNPRMIGIGEEIVKECCRLPLAIVGVANKLRVKDEFGWDRVLSNLRNPVYAIHDVIGQSISQPLSVSFDRLPIYGKDCLIYCALYPKDRKILTKELIQFWDMVMRDSDENMLDGIHMCRETINYLTNNAFLESVEINFDDYHEWGEGVQVHPIHREYALKNCGSFFLSKCGLKLRKLPHGSEWDEYLKGVSFMCNEIRTIKASPKCPGLHILLLNKNPDLCNIKNRFFARMLNLKILDLRDNSKLKSLPDSVSELVHLRALRLSRCWSLKRVPSLVKLSDMEMLELDETAIKELPHGIEMLVRLRVLKLHSLRLREPIPSNYLSMLSSLPHLELQL